jgi:hypothetical protein
MEDLNLVLLRLRKLVNLIYGIASGFIVLLIVVGLFFPGKPNDPNIGTTGLGILALIIISVPYLIARAALSVGIMLTRPEGYDETPKRVGGGILLATVIVGLVVLGASYLAGLI